MLDHLNENQRLAATHLGSPLIIIAGPGTGKTTTLIARIEHLIKEQGVAPSHILALTYTRKAAEEIRTRLGSTRDKKGPWIGTFHQLGHYIAHPDKEKLPIIPEPDRIALIKDLLKKTKLKDSFGLREAIQHISHFKQLGEPSELVEGYNTQLKEMGMRDYDDILIDAYTDLTSQKDGQYWPWTHILVDEFQDTNALQYKILKALAATHTNICAIGDPLQSIYSFQGATPTIFDQFAADFPSQRTIRLDINYRSGTDIVGLAKSLYPNGTYYSSASDKPGEAMAMASIDDYAEARWVLKKIQEITGGTDLLESGNMRALSDGHDLSFKDIAILYRTHFSGRFIEKALRQSGIPFYKVGEESFFQSAIMQNFLTFLENIDNLALTEALEAFYLQATPRTEEKDAINSILHHHIAQEQTIETFLQEIEGLRNNEFYDTDANRVTLMTMHAAKGQEFESVFIIGCNEGTMPCIRKRKGYESDPEEEKRLFYVALTRAKQKLFITSHAPSPFIQLLDTAYLSVQKDARYTRDVARKEKRALEKAQQKLF